jgi:hypothetical protein
MICQCVIFGGTPGRIPVRRETDLGTLIEYAPCPDCIGGIASCCDAAGSRQPEPEPEEKR